MPLVAGIYFSHIYMWFSRRENMYQFYPDEIPKLPIPGSFFHRIWRYFHRSFFSFFFLFISYESTYPAAGHMQITEQERIWNLIILQFSSHRRVLVILSALKPSVFAITLLECAVRSFRKKRRCPCYMILDSSILKYEDITIGLYIYFCRF